MAELHDRLIIVRVVDSEGNYVRNALVQLVIDDEPFTQAYDTPGPVTFQASDTGKQRVHVSCGAYDGWFDYTDGMPPIEVVIREEGHAVGPNKGLALPKTDRSSAHDMNASTTKLSTALKGIKIAAALIGFAVVLVVIVRFTSRWWPDPHKPDDAYGRWVSDEPHDKDVAIIFIHGVFGKNKDTWSGGPISFTQLLAQDPEIKSRADVYEFGYYSPYFGPAQNITQTAIQLHRDLHHDAVIETHKKVVFVAHSMGGLILRKFLVDYQQSIHDKLAMMYFFATPTNGAELALVAKKLSNNRQLSGLIPLEANEALQSIQTGWYASPFLPQKPSYCAFETLPVDNLVLVVSQSSATQLCNRQPEPITADHISIVKPASRSEAPYVVLADALKETVFLAPSPVVPSSPHPKHPADDCDNPDVGKRSISCLGQ